MSAPEPPADPTEPWPPTRRHYWQMRHDVDDVYDLLGKVDRKVDALARTQDEHSARFDAVDKQLTELRGQFSVMQGQLVEVLQAVRPHPPAG
jgi:septal ring factor EnvC (AmiA/AmiB activator)